MESNKTFIGDDGIAYTTMTETEEFNSLNTGFHLYCKQDECFTNKGTDEFVYGYDVNGPYDEKKQRFATVKRYGHEQNLDVFLEKYNNFEYGSIKFFYEMFQTNQARLEHYDCDVEFKDGAIYATRDPARFIEYFEQLRSRFIRNDETFKQIYGDLKPEWRITDASSDTKLSLHLINLNNTFCDFEDNKNFSDRFIAYVQTFEPDFVNIFDKAIYSRNRLFRCIGSTKKGQQRPFRKATWHQPSCNAPLKQFFATNVDQKNVKLSKKTFEKLVRVEKKIQVQETKAEKKVEKFVSTFEAMETVDEGEDENELLCSLIAETIKNQSSSLCDGEFKDKINYGNLMKISFAYINSLKAGTDVEDSKNFWETDIYRSLYRHSEEHNSDAIWNCFVNSKNNNVNKFTKASLHYWAKEHPNYNSLFRRKEKHYEIEDVGQFDIDDKSYYWSDFFRQITSFPVWDSKQQLFDFFVKHFPKVASIVLSGSEQFYLKIDEANNYQHNKLVSLGDIYYLQLVMGEPARMKMRFEEMYNETRRFFTRYQDIKFEPYDIYNNQTYQPNPNVINTFNGFKAKLIPDYYVPTFSNFQGFEQIAPILNHIKEVWANNDEQDFQYIISWLANIVKFPHRLNKTMITLISDNEQVGKGIIVEWILRSIIGLSISGKTGEFENITGRFNSFIMNKIMIALDEMNNHESYRDGAFTKFKTYITDQTQTVEVKGIDQKITIQNHVNYICMTNQAGAIKISTGDKRIAVFNCSDKYSGNRAYFNTLSKSLGGEKSADLFFTFLYNLPNEILVDPRDIPNNQAKQDMARITMEQPRKFLLEIQNGEYELGKNKRIQFQYRGQNSDGESKSDSSSEAKTHYSLEELYDEFNNWIYKSGEKAGKYSKQKFSTNIRASISKSKIRIDENGERTSNHDFNPVWRYDITTIDIR